MTSIKVFSRLLAPLVLLPATLVLAQTPADPVSLPTGMAITPNAVPHSVFQPLNPHLANLPNFVAGDAVSTALSPDGTQLLVLTSGFNAALDLAGKAQTNEYIFIFSTAGLPPRETQVLTIPNSFCGLAWNPNGQEFYVSGGVDDKMYVFGRSGTVSANDPTPTYSQVAAIALGHKTGNGLLSNAPAPYNALAPQPMTGGIGVSQSGAVAVVANFFNDSISVVDLKARATTAELDLRPGVTDPTKVGVAGGEYPFWVAVHADDKAYISSLRDREVVVVKLGGTPVVSTRIAIAGQPNRMIFNKAQNRLFAAVDNSDTVAIIDTAADQQIGAFPVTAPRAILPGSSLPKGANPNNLALSPDEKTLYVTEGGTNAVAVVSLLGNTGQVTGLIPTAWYPTAVTTSVDGKLLFVTNGKSLPGPNPGNCRGDAGAPGVPDCANITGQYIQQIETAGLHSFPIPSGAELAGLTERVASNDNFAAVEQAPFSFGPVMDALRQQIQHVIYVVKENRTYDQVLGDLEVGNGDPSIAEFPELITPNHHSLARNFVTLDNFLVSGEVSGVGWNWTTAARATDYTEKTVPPNYAGRGFTYDFEGTNRNVNPAYANLAQRAQAQPLLAINPATGPDPNLLPGTADVAALDSADGESGAGYIWDEALRAGLTIRNYGFYLDLARYQGSPSTNPAYVPISKTPQASGITQAFPTKTSLLNLTDPYYRGFDQSNSDVYNYQEWAREFDQYVANGNLPNLSLVRLPHDHFGNFSTALYGLNTPALQISDNDYALGLLVQKVAASPYSGNTLIFVIEDDAQDGPDHVDAHRSVAYVLGPYVKQGAVVSERYTTVNMIRTMEVILGLTPDSLNAAGAAPMTEVFDPFQTTWTYKAVVPSLLQSTQVPLLKRPNKVMAKVRDRHSASYWQKKLGDMDYSEEDKLDTARFNAELWKGMMGNKPYPTERTGKDLRENRKALLAKYGF